MAAAALIRLGREEKITEYLPTEQFTPEVGQGALGIEIRSDDEASGSLVSRLNHQPTWQCVIAERAFLKVLGGGCRTPITAFGKISDGILRLDGMIAGINNNKILRCSLEGNAAEPKKLGTSLAQKMIDMGAFSLITEAYDHQM
jgi:hydroxymethylbilane synthase